MPEFKLDIYKDYSHDQLKEHCRRLARATGRWQHIAMVLAGSGIEALSVEDRSDLEILIEAYTD